MTLRPPADNPPSDIRNPRLLLALALAATVLVLYAPVADFGFVNFDDDLYVSDNRHVRAGLSAEGIRWAFSTTTSGHWHPLTWLSLMLDCELFGPNPGALHLVNVVLHAVTSALLFLWLATATRWPGAALAAAGLFALHPLRVESVAWITERKDVLSGLLLVLTLWAYRAYSQRRSLARYLPVAVGFFLALLAKPTVLLLPFGLLLLDFWPLERLRESEDRSQKTESGRILVRLVAEKLPFLALSFAAIVATTLAQRSMGSMIRGDGISGASLATALWGYVRYLGKSLWPSNLAVFYPLAPVSLAQTITGFTLVVVVTLLAIQMRKRAPYLIVGWLWFAGMLLPMSGVVQFGGQAIADRFTYVPHIGLAVAVTWLAGDLLRSATLRLLVTGIVLAGLAAKTAHHLPAWRDSEALFRQALSATTHNYMAHNNLALALAASGRETEALGHLEEAARIHPEWPVVQVNLGNAYARRGEYAWARAHYRAALRVQPNHSVAENNLGTAYSREGDFAAAARHFRRALEIDPENLEARRALVDLHERQGNDVQAALHLEELIRIAPRWPGAAERLRRLRRNP